MNASADEANPFLFEAVMDLVRTCRSDDAISRIPTSTPYRQVLVKRHVIAIGGRYGVDPQRLAHVTALMMEGRDVAPAFADVPPAS